MRNELTDRASEDAIKLFRSPATFCVPIRDVTLGLDTVTDRCKVAVVDCTGKVLDTGVIYPTRHTTKRNKPAGF